MFKVYLSQYPTAAEGLLFGKFEVPGADQRLLLLSESKGFQILLVLLALEGEGVLLDAFVGENILE